MHQLWSGSTLSHHVFKVEISSDPAHDWLPINQMLLQFTSSTDSIISVHQYQRGQKELPLYSAQTNTG
jgi:hypothetical protein